MPLWESNTLYFVFYEKILYIWYYVELINPIIYFLNEKIVSFMAGYVNVSRADLRIYKIDKIPEQTVWTCWSVRSISV